MRRKDKLFDKYYIIQDDAFFKLGQDSVFLSYFASLSKGERCLDIGAGCGALTLLALLKRPDIQVEGVELNPQAVDICNENIALNGFSANGSCRASDFRNMDKELYGKYDVCLANPPYFSVVQGKTHSNQQISAARSEQTGDVFDVCLAARQALKWGGRFYVCYKPERIVTLMAALEKAELETKAIRMVYHKPGGEAILILLEARRGAGQGAKILPPLYVCDELGHKTEEYLYIYGGDGQYDR